MKNPTAAVAVLALAVAVAFAASAAAAPLTPRGQQVHLFEVTVHVPDSRVIDPDEYNYLLLATVLGRLHACFTYLH
ncbi:hypothetical protein GUJ93_ZPchr0004g38600 [Zizania palustris]|uniref:rRNA N-glycosidase n=1 Tax=Zizania palustris TaxID=103762 RepID=A0A8J5S204_ZIZPA|nr:hypothetical protein GUJ93_ZPchr0004g38600 [Zizania palustris]